LTSLLSSESCKLNYPDLLNACEEVSIEITDAVEKETRSHHYGLSAGLEESLHPG